MSIAMKVRTVASVMVAGVVLASGCETKSDPQPPAAPQTDGAGAPAAPPPASPQSGLGGSLGNVGGAVSGLMGEGKEKAVTAARDGLALVTTKLGELRGSASSVPAENRPAFDQVVADAEEKLKGLAAKVEDLSKASADAWQSISTDVQGQLSSLMETVNQAITQYAKG